MSANSAIACCVQGNCFFVLRVAVAILSFAIRSSVRRVLNGARETAALFSGATCFALTFSIRFFFLAGRFFIGSPSGPLRNSDSMIESEARGS